MPAWRKWFRPFRALSVQGVLGMNRRNIAYISRYNSRALYPLVDDKLRTKRLAIDHGVNAPALLGVIGHQHDVAALPRLTANLPGFCIKPAKGSGGKGILVARRAEDGSLLRSNGQPLDLRDLQRHVSNILAGLFSLAGSPDVAVIEALIQVDESFQDYSFEGVPDVRVIVFRGYPVMAMMRLSCAASSGKANLHQGAIGVGIDIGSGRAVKAIQHDRPVQRHPDTGQALALLQVPEWENLLWLACACADMTGLGYLGVDIVLDREHGPMLLELNARPGLAIQLANGAGLLPRLEQVEGRDAHRQPGIAQRVAFARRHFGSRDFETETAAEPLPATEPATESAIPDV